MRNVCVYAEDSSGPDPDDVDVEMHVGHPEDRLGRWVVGEQQALSAGEGGASREPALAPGWRVGQFGVDPMDADLDRRVARPQFLRRLLVHLAGRVHEQQKEYE